MKIGVFGGSFNPPHRGHLVAAEAFCRGMALDRLLVIPAGIPPHKTMEKCCSDLQRVEMAKRNFASLNIPVTVSDMEIVREGKSYTVDTLRELKKSYPEDELFLYCGGDMLRTFHLWYRYEEILSLCTLCVMKREEDEAFDRAARELSRLSPRPVRVIEAPYFEISSTRLRQALKEGLCTGGLIPAVEEYIKEEGIYQ